jgi:hypothetical protein
MTAGQLLARRATLDDLELLRGMWRRAGLAEGELERRLTEFQVVVQLEGGPMVGAIGLRLEGRDGVLHSESYMAAEVEGEARLELWERVQALARNHGLHRLWIRNGHPFWKSEGFVVADEAAMSLKPRVGNGVEGDWLVLVVREENPAARSMEKEFALFKQEQEAMSMRAMRQAQYLRWIIWVAAFGAVLALLWLLWRLVQPIPGF